MDVIVIETEAFYKLVEEVTKKLSIPIERKWIQEEELMELTGIKSKSTIQEWRNLGKIRFTQPSKKIILYDRESVMKFLDDNAQASF